MFHVKQQFFSTLKYCKTINPLLQKEKWLWWQMMGSHAVQYSFSGFPYLVDQEQVDVLYMYVLSVFLCHLVVISRI